jgi:hypothetical protein
VSAQTNGNSPDGGLLEPLMVVRVEDAIEQTLTGRAAGAYESPAQPRAQAIALVSLLVGYRPEQPGGQERWVVPIAGGRRVITLTGESTS